MSPPWDFAPWLYLVSKPLAHGCLSKMLLLGQMFSPRLLEPERKSLTSKMNPPWDIAPWLYLVLKLLANGCPSQMLTQGQVLRSYILKPLRKDLTSIMSFILSLLIFGGQNVHYCVQTLIPNLCMTFKRWQDYEWRPEARQPPYIFYELASQMLGACKISGYSVHWGPFQGLRHIQKETSLSPFSSIFIDLQYYLAGI